MYTCHSCKKRFTLTPELSSDSADNNICPYCGGKDIKKNSLLSFFRGILSSGGG
jgi:rRNA maturation endonuclease Nob1